MTRLWVIVNPTAAGGRCMARWRRFERLLLHEGIAYQRCFTMRSGHATELAHGAIKDGAERIAAFGGDGTLHEVVQAIAGSHVAVIFLPAGSSCDFAKDLPPRSLLERIQSRQTRARDLIRIHCTGLDGGGVDGYAVNGANLGIVANAAQRLNAHPLRGWSVDLAAVAAGLSAYQTLAPPEFELHYDERPARACLLNLSILKSDRLCGQMRFGVPTSFDDGQLVAVAAAPAPLPGLLSALYRGRAAEHPAVTWRQCDSVRVCGPAGVVVEADGEIFGRSPACFSVVSRALQVAI